MKRLDLLSFKWGQFGSLFRSAMTLYRLGGPAFVLQRRTCVLVRVGKHRGGYGGFSPGRTAIAATHSSRADSMN